MLVAMRRLGGFIETHNYTTTVVAVTLSLVSSSAQLESNQLFCLLLLLQSLSLYVSSLTYLLTHSLTHTFDLEVRYLFRVPMR